MAVEVKEKSDTKQQNSLKDQQQTTASTGNRKRQILENGDIVFPNGRIRKGPTAASAVKKETPFSTTQDSTLTATAKISDRDNKCGHINNNGDSKHSDLNDQQQDEPLTLVSELERLRGENEELVDYINRLEYENRMLHTELYETKAQLEDTEQNLAQCSLMYQEIKKQNEVKTAELALVHEQNRDLVASLEEAQKDLQIEIEEHKHIIESMKISREETQKLSDYSVLLGNKLTTQTLASVKKIFDFTSVDDYYKYLESSDCKLSNAFVALNDSITELTYKTEKTEKAFTQQQESADNTLMSKSKESCYSNNCSYSNDEANNAENSKAANIPIAQQQSAEMTGNGEGVDCKTINLGPGFAIPNTAKSDSGLGNEILDGSITVTMEMAITDPNKTAADDQEISAYKVNADSLESQLLHETMCVARQAEETMDATRSFHNTMSHLLGYAFSGEKVEQKGLAWQ